MGKYLGKSTQQCTILPHYGSTTWSFCLQTIFILPRKNKEGTNEISPW